MELHKYQEQALDDLSSGKHFLILSPGTGKTACAMRWAEQTGKHNLLIVTTASVRDAKQMEQELEMWTSEAYNTSLSSFSVVGWQGLAKWLKIFDANSNDSLDDYAIIFDEGAYAKAGVKSQRGKAFLKLTRRTDCWIGLTATPGDRWIDFQAYAIATGLVRNLTEFRRKFCIMQDFKGFPEIVGYQNTDDLSAWWDSVSVRPDASAVFAELPDEVHKTIRLPTPTGYKKVLKTACRLEDGELIETAPEMLHYLRQMVIMDKHRQDWIADFLENNNEQIVFFTNYKAEAEMVAELCKKHRPAAKVWKIDGESHDIPTAETMGNNDIVVANYKSGSEGLNLQFLHYTVFVSYNYSYSTSIQARGRQKRLGQKHTMFYYYLHSQNTIDDDILKALKSKSDFAAEEWRPND